MTNSNASDTKLHDISGELSDEDLEKVSGGRGTRPAPVIVDVIDWSTPQPVPSTSIIR